MTSYSVVTISGPVFMKSDDTFIYPKEIHTYTAMSKETAITFAKNKFDSIVDDIRDKANKHEIMNYQVNLIEADNNIYSVVEENDGLQDNIKHIVQVVPCMMIMG